MTRSSSRSFSRRLRGDSAPLVVSLLLLLLLLGAALAWHGLGALTALHSLLRGAPWLLWILASALPVYLVVGAFALRPKSSSKSLGERLAVAHVYATVALLGAGVYGIFFQTYNTAHAYSQRAVVTDGEVTSFHERAPWVVANNYASRDQGDDVGERGSVVAVPNSREGTSRYTTLITGRSFAGMVGYKSVREFDLPLVGSIPASAAKSCEFPASMGLRVGAFWPTRSLDRAIHNAAPFKHFKNEDAYGYCREGKPVVVVPLWTYEGAWTSTRVPAGVAVYEESGLRVLSGAEAAAEKIEGPTFPKSLSILQREALSGMGSLSDFYGGRSGYDGTEKDSEDANAGNQSEFTLVGLEGGVYRVTPLTPRGSSQSITALAVVPGQQTGTEADRKFTVETAVDLPATSSIENDLRSKSVSGDSEWTARWASGMKVYEVLPTSNGHWVASIGLGQTVNYRADIAPSGAVTITRTDGEKPKEEGKEGSVTVEGGKPLSEMTEEELVALIKAAADELGRR